MSDKKKAFTLVEVIVIIFTCMFLLFVLPVLFRRPRSVAFRNNCGVNLCRIGNAIRNYSADYDDEYPRAGGPQTVWAKNVRDWKALNRFDAYGVKPDGTGGQASISAALYLLIKHLQIEPKNFICTEDKSDTEFKPADYDLGKRDKITLWDFGPEPQKHLSYSYHVPFGGYALTTSSDPNMAVAADRNPWIDSPFSKSRDFTKFKPGIAPFNGTREQTRSGNALFHQTDGQNVLFIDGHVSFKTRPDCGIDNDNIYTSWDRSDKARGIPPRLGSKPANQLDSLLVNDPP